MFSWCIFLNIHVTMNQHGADQIAQMHRLIWAFAVHIYTTKAVSHCTDISRTVSCKRNFRATAKLTFMFTVQDMIHHHFENRTQLCDFLFDFLDTIALPKRNRLLKGRIFPHWEQMLSFIAESFSEGNNFSLDFGVNKSTMNWYSRLLF